mmetsp:Transcript_23562/g.41763  ORF Transcript_23562/g.41763 Transcript_23562/m.41763 type:complete len:303 (+) Transcript_23562:238-1146(+)
MSSAAEVFRQLLNDSDNAHCVDCRRPGAQWASVSMGAFLCIECSGKHRGLGVHISFVRSLTMDAWNNLQLKQMMLGGNSRLIEFFEEYGLTSASLDRYYSKAAEYYRTNLKAEAEGRKSELHKPNLDEGREFHIQPPRLEYKADSFKPVSSSQGQGESGGFWSSATSFLSSAVSAASDIASEAASRVRDQGIFDKVKSTAASVYDRSVEVSSNIYEAVKETGAINTIKETSAGAYSSVSSFASRTYNRLAGTEQDQYQRMDDSGPVSFYRPPKEVVQKEEEDFFAQYDRPQQGGRPKVKKLD